MLLNIRILLKSYFHIKCATILLFIFKLAKYQINYKTVIIKASSSYLHGDYHNMLHLIRFLLLVKSLWLGSGYS